MKKAEMLFYPVNPSEKNTGLKFVLWAIIKKETGTKTYDWGFCNWSGEEWDIDVPVPDGYEALIAYWANTINPDVLLKEPPRIIKV